MNCGCLAHSNKMGDATGITSLLIEPRVADRRAFDGRRVSAPPVIDGRLDETSWAASRTGVFLADNATADSPKAETAVFLAWDEEAL